MDPLRKHEQDHQCRVVRTERTPYGTITKFECVPRSGPGMRDLYVDVCYCRADIAEMVDHDDGTRSVRYLKRGFVNRRRFSMLGNVIGRIIDQENHGALDRSGHYRAQTAYSRRRLIALVEDSERSAAAQNISPWS